MATDKLFTVAGISKLDGEYKVRFANDVLRVKVLAKHGHEDVRLIELDTPMGKVEAANFIKTLDEFSDVNAQATIADYLDRHAPKTAAPKAATKAKAPAKAPKAAKSTAKVDLSDIEDAPF